jgi:hypothetical protein
VELVAAPVMDFQEWMHRSALVLSSGVGDSRMPIKHLQLTTGPRATKISVLSIKVAGLCSSAG